MFKKLNTAFQWIMINKYNTSGLSHFTDNFFFIGPPNSDKWLKDVQLFEKLSETICLPIKKSKTVLPTTKIAKYRIEADCWICQSF